MAIKIGDYEFKVATATLTGNITFGKLSWSIDIKGTPRRGRQEVWHPRVYSQRLLPIDDLNLRRWQDAFVNDIIWKSCYCEAQGVEQATIYVVEHNDIYDSMLSIKPTSNQKLKITWSAKCDIFFDGCKDNIDLEIDAEGDFNGIIVGNLGEQISPEEARKRLREYIVDDSSFLFLPATDEYEFPRMKVRINQ